MTKIKAVLFDKDGCLIAFNNVWGPVYKKMMMEHFSYSESDAIATLVRTGFVPETGGCLPGSALAAATVKQIVRIWWPDLSEADYVERIQFIINNIDPDTKNYVEALPGLEASLQTLLKGGIKLGIGTNDTEASAKAHMEKLGITSLFTTIIGQDTVAQPKPSGDMIRLFAQRLGLATDEIAMIGDNVHDIEEARAGGAGLAVGITTGTSEREHLAPHADVVIDRLLDLPGIISP